ncbi:MAG: macrolide family glycosyltransferase [Bacilli bacterium]|nr:macrolide family glycosyltransferase [Bacilli bacterium]
MYKIAFFNIPAHGHTNPTREVVKELVRLGHEVRYYSFDVMKEKIESTGATFISCDEYDLMQKLSLEEVDRVTKDLEFSIKILVDTTLSIDEALVKEMKEWHPDCIVSDSMALWGKLIALKLEVPFISSTTTFAFNQYSSKIMKQNLFEIIKTLIQMKKADKHVKRLQEKGYPINNVLDIIQNDNDTYTIVYTSKEFQPYSETFSEKYYFVGPSICKNNTEIKRKNNKAVYISLGTVNNQLKSFYYHCIEAFKDSDIQVIMSVGDTIDISEFQSYSENIKIYNYVDQIEILQNVDLFITHCGMNSVSEALYYQVPLILFPQTKEQSGVAYRVNELGAGKYLENNTVAAIKNACNEVFNNESYKQNVNIIAQSFYRCGGSQAAVEAILNVISKAEI